MDILKKLFIDWDLETWANTLEVIGFLFSILTFIISLFLRSEIKNLKSSYVFDKTVKKHIESLSKSASLISQNLNDYDNNIQAIKTEFSNCVAELEDLIPKVSYRQSWKSRRLLSFLKSRKNKHFEVKNTANNLFIHHFLKKFKRVYLTTYDDVWIVYNNLTEIVRKMENIKHTKSKAL